MKNINKKFKLLILIILSVLTLSSVVFAIKNVAVPSSNNTYSDSSSGVEVQNEESAGVQTPSADSGNAENEGSTVDVDFENMSDEEIASLLSSKYFKSQKEILEMKASLGSWEKVMSELEKFFETLTLTQEQKVELIDEGYKLQDIDQAEELALSYGVTPVEILQMKEGEENSEEAVSTGSNEEEKDVQSWEEVRFQLDVKNSLLMSNESEDVKEKIEADLCDKNKRMKISKNKKQQIEKGLLKESNVTSTDIALCKKNGITENIDIFMAKNLSEQYNTTLQNVLDVKKDKDNWEDVKNELEVKTDEK